MKQGRPIAKALREAGYSRTQARKGMARIAHTKALRQAVQKELEQWARAAGEIIRVAIPRTRAEMVRARLTMNVVRGEDKAVQSCKLLGQDKELSLWESQSQQGDFCQWLIATRPAGLLEATEECGVLDEENEHQTGQ